MSQKIFNYDIALMSSVLPLNIKLQYDFIIGCDEAGRGAGAGPLYASAVCFVNYKKADEILVGLNDSKKLSEKARSFLFPLIKENSIYSIKFASIEEIESLNVLNAALETMKKAALEVIEKLHVLMPSKKNILVLIDGSFPLKNFNYPQNALIKGDSLSAAIAAASVLSKVSRDEFMIKCDEKYPNYGFKNNKGYLTKEHITALKALGLSKIHRPKFLQNLSPRF